MNALLPFPPVLESRHERRPGREIFVDNFAGGGGASEGIRIATGRSPDVAINHDPEAVAMHAANHPEAEHLCQSVYRADPVDVAAGRPVGGAWFSPDCKHFSKAKGGQPLNKNVRDLAWVVIHWAERVAPRVIFLENVEEFQDWGPLIQKLDENGEPELDRHNRPKMVPDPDRKGATFRKWVAALRRLGYRVEWKELRACDYGVPTTRKRLFVIARRDGLPITWPEPTHGPGRASPWRTAADSVIDFSIPCPSIFLSPAEAKALGVRRPLEPATLERIANGVRRYVLEAEEPFIVPPGTAAAEFGDRRTLVAAFMAQHNTGMVGHPMTRPVSTIVQKGCTQAVVATSLVKLRRHSTGAPVDEPIHTITTGGHFAELRAFLMKYYGQGGQDQEIGDPLHSVTTKPRFGLVTVGTSDYAIADIGMRMLTPRELFRAQGFRPDYIIAPEVDRVIRGRTVRAPITQEAQYRMCGNSVCPDLAAAIIRANYVDLPVPAEAAE